MKSNTQAYKFALIAVFLWSTVATAFKFSLKYLSPEELVFYSSLTSLIALFIIILKQKKLKEVSLHIKENTKIVLILGALNPFLYYLVLFKAYDLLPAQEAQAINYTWALMLAFLSVPFLKQKLRLLDIVAGIVCYFGVLIIATKGSPFSMSFTNIQGIGLALFSTVLWALYWVFNTKTKADPVVCLFSNFLFATPMILVYCLISQPIALPNASGLLGAIYVGLFEMGITFLFWLKAMQTAQNTSNIANLIFISPFVSLVLIYFILGEKILISTSFGLIFILVGLAIQKFKS